MRRDEERARPRRGLLDPLRTMLGIMNPWHQPLVRFCAAISLLLPGVLLFGEEPAANRILDFAESIPGIDGSEATTNTLDHPSPGAFACSNWVVCLTNEHTLAGFMREMGEGAVVDLHEALREYTRAAEEGDPEGLCRLSAGIRSLSSAPRDRALAFQFVLRAAKKGYCEAVHKVGEAYEHGLGVATNKEQAMACYRAAAEKGHTEAMHRLALAYGDGTGVATNIAESMRYYRLACEGGDPFAMSNLAVALLNGRAGPNQWPEAAYWLYRAYRGGCTLHENSWLVTFMEREPNMWTSVRYRWLSEYAPDKLAVKIGDTTNQVRSLLGKPDITGSSRVGNEPVVIDWGYPCGSVGFRDGVVVSSTIILSPADVAAKQHQTYPKPKSPVPWRVHPVYRPPDPKYWALATTAILTEINKERHDMLGGHVVTPDNTRRQRWMLLKTWNIGSKKEFLQEIAWLEQAGHRREFTDLGKELSMLPENEKSEAIFRILEDGLQKHRLRLVVDNYEKMGARELVGWDFCRLVSLCRWGYVAGYLGEEEAWTRIMSAAQRLQSTFASWGDMGANYLLGRQFSSGQKTQKDGDRFQAAYDKLMKDPKSPWQCCPWNTNLTKPPVPQTDEPLAPRQANPPTQRKTRHSR